MAGSKAWTAPKAAALYLSTNRGYSQYNGRRYNNYQRHNDDPHLSSQQFSNQQHYDPQHNSNQQYHDEQQWEYRPDGPEHSGVRLLRPTLWALGFTAGTFYLCSSSFADHRERLRVQSGGILAAIGLRTQQYDEEERVWALMSDGHVRQLVGRAHTVGGEKHARAIRRIAHLPAWVPLELKRTGVMLADKWYRLSAGERCVYTIVGLNAVVFGMWQIPRLLPFMARNFLHDPRSGRSFTLLTSTFSHRELFHFAFNTIALVSFGTSVADIMGVEHFTAFYLSAGVVSSLVSHLLMPLRPALMLPSLGASGAVYSVVGATMMMFPHAKIALIFLPFLPFTISQAFPALLAYDLAGAVLGWRSFNHVAHLAGGLYGIAYMEWGAKQWARLTLYIEERRAHKAPKDN
ncbi:hypothetical protein LPJ66_010891 [Kickxella alabastrina]|uniref:Uncharacterized protein n=1 Tax=Kickxella alabastrina TaxID=61397 RepID=A0ACC1HZ76_9FUNG|nr:hypothetical protein LPJ66_010891 [Kickxella alabastrina]